MSNVLHDAQQTVVRVRPDEAITTSQRLPYFVGISRGTAGAAGLSMYMVVVPPGGHAEPHCRADYETAIYMLEGRVETRYGPGLRESVITEAGDFLFYSSGHAASAVQSGRHTRSKSDSRAQSAGRARTRWCLMILPGMHSARPFCRTHHGVGIGTMRCMRDRPPPPIAKGRARKCQRYRKANACGAGLLARGRCTAHGCRRAAAHGGRPACARGPGRIVRARALAPHGAACQRRDQHGGHYLPEHWFHHHLLTDRAPRTFYRRQKSATTSTKTCGRRSLQARTQKNLATIRMRTQHSDKTRPFAAPVQLAITCKKRAAFKWHARRRNHRFHCTIACACSHRPSHCLGLRSSGKRETATHTSHTCMTCARSEKLKTPFQDARNAFLNRIGIHA